MTVTSTHPWYDSPWLRAYVEVKAVLKDQAPHLLDQFVAEFDVLRTRPDFTVQTADGIIDDPTVQELRSLIENLSYRDLEFHELSRFGRLVVHDHPYVSRLQQNLTARVSEIVGEDVEPSYNFLSLYHDLGRCEVHMDAPNAKWTVDICLHQSRPWPLHISQVREWPEIGSFDNAAWASQIKNDPANHFSEYTMRPGDAIVFVGSSQWHHREPMVDPTASDFAHLLFLHFIPKNAGPVTDQKRWPELFPFVHMADDQILLLLPD